MKIQKLEKCHSGDNKKFQDSGSKNREKTEPESNPRLARLEYR